MNRLLLIPLVIGLVFSGCIEEPSTKETPIEGGVKDAVNATLPKTETEDFTLSATFATPARSFNNGGPAKLIKPTANTTGFIVEVAWTAANQATQRMSVWIRKEGDGAVSADNPTFLVNSPPPIKQADGPSPIKVALPVSLLKEGQNYQVYLRASANPVGVGANQEAKLYLTSFQDIPFDEAFSAIKK